MARIRTIKPMFWVNEDIVALPFEYRLLFIGLWNFADDEGFMKYKPAQIKLQVFPGDDVNITAGIKALSNRGKGPIEVIDIPVDGENVKVLRIKNWKDHQVISRPTKSLLHEAYNDYQAQDETHGALHTLHGGLHREGKGKEGKGREGKGKEVTQVGGGGHLSSADDPAAADLLEPWRCIDHQGVDVPCHGCKAAKDAHKRREADQAKAAKDAPRLAREAALAADAAAIKACDLCDNKGRRGDKVCHHVESVGMPDDIRKRLKEGK